MAGRDPETGQFVSGGGRSGDASYRDFDSVHYRGTFRDNGAGNNAAYSMQSIAQIEPAGGLDRQEEAELVALHIHEARTEIDEATLTTAPEGLRSGFELSRDEDIGALTQFRTQVDLANNASEGDAPGSPLSRQVQLSDPDILWFALGRVDATGNGRTTYAHGEEHINYRALLGGGPVFRGASDELHLHGRLNNVDNESNWVSDIQFTTFWHVRDAR